MVICPLFGRGVAFPMVAEEAIRLVIGDVFEARYSSPTYFEVRSPLIFSRFLFNRTATMKFHPQSTAYWLLIAITLTSTTSISSAFVAQPSGFTAAVTTCTSRCNHRGRIGAPLQMAQDEPSKDEKSDDRQSYIDAVVEEKTAGLAEVDEENTSVRLCLCRYELAARADLFCTR